MTDQQFPDPTEIRHPIGASGSFSLSNISGDVRLRGADTEEAVVVARSTRGHKDALPLNVRKSNGMLSIEIDQKASFWVLGWRNAADVEFDVTLPRGARVDVSAVSADIQASGLVGEQTYKTVSGNVVLDGVGGRIALSSVSGDVRLEGADLVEPRASSTSGDVEIHAPSLRAIQLKTVSGDATVRGAFDTGALHSIETVSGDVAIDSSSGLTVEFKKGIDFSGEGKRERVVGDGAARLRFRTLSGDLELNGDRVKRGHGVKWRVVLPELPKMPLLPEMPVMPAAPGTRSAPAESDESARARAGAQADSLEILRALERGEIDVDEASRRLEGSATRG